MKTIPKTYAHRVKERMQCVWSLSLCKPILYWMRQRQEFERVPKPLHIHVHYAVMTFFVDSSGLTEIFWYSHQPSAVLFSAQQKTKRNIIKTYNDTLRYENPISTIGKNYCVFFFLSFFIGLLERTNGNNKMKQTKNYSTEMRGNRNKNGRERRRKIKNIGVCWRNVEHTMRQR